MSKVSADVLKVALAITVVAELTSLLSNTSHTKSIIHVFGTGFADLISAASGDPATKKGK